MAKFDFFTSDTHFGSERTLSLSRRPFNNTDEMDEIIIKNFNEKMSKSSNLLHLGDFGDYKRLQEINANVYLLMGNYEEDEMRERFHGMFTLYRNYLLKLGFTDVYRGLIPIIPKAIYPNVKYLPSTILAAHQPTKIASFDSNMFGIFGHIHGRQKIKKFGIDVGVDANFFYPITIDDVDFYYNAIKNFYDNDVFV